jgi:hypothetical protein
VIVAKPRASGRIEDERDSPEALVQKKQAASILGEALHHAGDVQVGYKLSEEEATVAWQASGRAVTNMTDSKPEQPWILQLLQDWKTERFRVALEKIASRATDLDAMSPEQARAALREVIRDASIALNS